MLISYSGKNPIVNTVSRHTGLAPALSFHRIRSFRIPHKISIAAQDFSPNGCTPLLAATSAAGPVADFSPASPLLEHPLQAHDPSPQGQTPVSPPQPQVVFSVPGTCCNVFSFSALLFFSFSPLLPLCFPAFKSARRRASAWISRTCLSLCV